MIFLGKRTENGCLVYKIGEDMSIEELTPDRSLEVYNHSPTGFEWGYGGSGPHQLALAILIEALTEHFVEGQGIEETPEQTALRLYHQFVWSVVCHLDADGKLTTIEEDTC